MRTIILDIQTITGAPYPNRKLLLSLIDKRGARVGERVAAITDANSNASVELESSESGYKERKYILAFDTVAIAPVELYIPDGEGELLASLCQREWKSRKVEEFVRVQNGETVSDEALLWRIDRAWVTDEITAYEKPIKEEFERYADYTESVNIWEYKEMDKKLYAMYENYELPQELING